MAAREYVYRGEFTTAVIKNEKRYWSLTITHNSSNFFQFGRNGRRITNTKKRAVEIWEAVEEGQFKMMNQFKKQ